MSNQANTEARINAICLDATEALAYGDNSKFLKAVDAYAATANVDKDEAQARCIGAFHAMTGGRFAGQGW